MAFYRPRRRRRVRWPWPVGIGASLIVIVVAAWWLSREQDLTPRSANGTPRADANQGAPPAGLDAPDVPRITPTTDVVTRNEEEVLIPAGDDADTRREPGADFAFREPADPAALQDPTGAALRDDTRTGNTSIEQARKLIDDGKPIEARAQLAALHRRGLSGPEDVEVRALLKRLADETIFSRRAFDDDPLVEQYTVQDGDRLVNIAPRYDVPYDIILTINGVPDATKLRVGQRLKIPRGPFHARIYKSQFRLDIYLGDVFVRSYRVGLGVDNGTPEGGWEVKDRLQNPTYHPPASAVNKEIIHADDPRNPLGEHWIGLRGVEGASVGQEGYGIHGTIEPESVGRAVSLGCVRMLNEDVAFLYSLLQPGKSRVTILP